MTLATGSKLGPYEILGPIGAGGMGEVYRARDPRLGREVAVKVLPASFSADPDRLRRFEQEARAAGVLNHPNITAVYDIGSADGAPYVVQELLEGESLRSVLAGSKLSPRKAVDYSLQIAHGLAAAHEKGIVHRDLKPENLFVTKDGRLKILDFGLAKLTHQEEGSQVTGLPTATAGTEPGVVMGTLGYMSPEQVRGRPADARSDIFSFGAILYEMLSGRRAFHGDSAADTMSAILREDPPELSVTNQNISPGLERIVRHCLEKNPEHRFHSAHDLAFDLEALSGTSAVGAAAPAGASRHRGRWRLAPGVVAAAAGLVLLGFWAGRRPAAGAKVSAPAVHERITFRRGNVLFARLTADGQNVVYSASWGDRPAEIYLTRIGSPETRPLGIPDANLLSVSPSGELAIQLKKSNLFGVVGTGTLARVPLGGGTPRQILENVISADWAPDGVRLAVLRETGGKVALEYPIGKRLSSVDGGFPRVSPDGRSVALIERGPSVALFDTSGKHRTIAQGFIYVDSQAWHPSGKEVWFAAVHPETGTGIFAADLDGHVRTVAPTTDLECLHDIAKDGSVLVERELNTREVIFASKNAAPRDLSWLDQSQLTGLSSDGKTILFSEQGEGGGNEGSVYMRSTDGAPAVRLGDGEALDLSPDGKWALTRVGHGADSRIVLLPTAAGEPRPIQAGNLSMRWAGFLPPDGKRIFMTASEPGHGTRGYVLDLAGGSPRLVTPEGLTGVAFSPDGKFLAVSGPEGGAWIYPVAGGERRPIPGLEPGDDPIQWSSDGASIFVARFGEMPLPISRLTLATGKRELFKELMPADRAGVVRIEVVTVTPDGQAWAYSYNRVTASDLYLVRGWK
ncbi:MAG TPA: protein kinase [Thermoanaerobaculia bacterium]|nr:protein kinase [Thermoanaerobaculia bacterium]